jgi:hypothetical protein
MLHQNMILIVRSQIIFLILNVLFFFCLILTKTKITFVVKFSFEKLY